MNGMNMSCADRWNRNLRETRSKRKLSQTDLAAMMNEHGYGPCSQKTISQWEHVGEREGCGFPPYRKMLGLAECLGVDVPYLTGDMDGGTYAQQYVADHLGTDPGVVSIFKELAIISESKSEFDPDDGSRIEIVKDNDADVYALLLMDSYRTVLAEKYKAFVAAHRDRRLKDDPDDAPDEKRRYLSNLRAARFELVDAFQAMLREKYPDPGLDDFLTDAGKEKKRRREREEEKRDEERRRRLLSAEGASPVKLASVASALLRVLLAEGQSYQDEEEFRRERAEELRKRIASDGWWIGAAEESRPV